MSMQDVVKAAREALQRCKARGKAPDTFKSDDGKSRKGWSICIVAYKSDERRFSNALGDFEEWWGDGCLFLGTDGKIYEHRFRGKTIGEARSNPGTTIINEVILAAIHDIRYPRLPFNTRRGPFEAVLEGLKAL